MKSCIAPPIINLGTRFRPFFHPAKNPGKHVIGDWVGPRPVVDGTVKILLLLLLLLSLLLLLFTAIEFPPCGSSPYTSNK